MKKIPFTRYHIITEAEREDVSDAMETGAAALMQFLVEQRELLAIIAQQATGMQMLMDVQNRIADAINASVAEGASAEDLAHNLTVILGEYTA